MRICFVCLGNICRSPTAHGVMERLVAEAGLAGALTIDSAGTGAYRGPPDLQRLQRLAGGRAAPPIVL
jgi:protein-tyrosine phosphatase